MNEQLPIDTTNIVLTIIVFEPCFEVEEIEERTQETGQVCVCVLLDSTS